MAKDQAALGALQEYPPLVEGAENDDLQET